MTDAIRDNADDVDTVNYKTLSRFVMANTADQELAILMGALALACKATARACRKAGIANLFGLAGDQNSSGDDQKKLDVLSNDIFINALLNCHACAVLVSEENDEPIIVPPEMQGKYCVAFDPLDGSSNIDCNVSTGTIFGVYEKTIPGPGTTDDILRKGQDLVVAGYCMYGAATELVICFAGRGVHRFALDPSIGEFIHTDANVKLPADGGKKIYSCNEGNSSLWDEPCKQSLAHFKAGDKPYAQRYVGSMVSDVHRTLLYGGIFMYPADKKSKNGKLRVLYEGFPMAMITEAAGGIASTGMFKGKVHRMMDLEPKDIHERCPVILGCPRDVNIVLDYYKKAEQAGAYQAAAAAATGN
eukprot:CAMPEP_0185160854 /NCGR_PEP_ID=MMETSP1139-20130426/4043_1 /TAXON_ID=298111 /ORGANISM="Pavlova sp., Strain CCMP459" /LENGTH=358 /DNA_ID=CAMNT_0027726073 /DNA_START=68 /DNA_END=1144 /DNA_ORIENTATION=-